ncbi:MAG: serine hydrolase domain-containing protein [bacterium]
MSTAKGDHAIFLQFLCLLVCIVFVFSGCSSEPPRPPVLTDDYAYTGEYLTWKIEKKMKKHNIKGLSIAIVDDQEEVWSRGFGLADVSGKIAATEETIYQVGSITKVFTVTGIMHLAEQGRLDIDESLNTCLPEFQVKTRFQGEKAITLRNLMTHHSGLPSDIMKGMWTEHPGPYEMVVEMLRDAYTAHPPDYVFSYSNVGFSLLGLTIERVSGTPYESYIEECVLDPLGMTHSAFSLSPELKPFLAKEYEGDRELNPYRLREVPAGGLYTTVRDLARFMNMIFAEGTAGRETILGQETLQEILRCQNSAIPLDMDFRIGLGWWLDDEGLAYAGRVAGHGGATLGTYSKMVTLLDHKLGIVVIANSIMAPVRKAVDEIARTGLMLALETKTGIKEPSPEKNNEPGIVSLADEEQQELTGTYATCLGVLTVDTCGERRRVHLWDKVYDLVPMTNGLYSMKYRVFGLFPLTVKQLAGITFTFERIDGRQLLALVRNNKRYLLGPKIQPVSIPPAWLDRLGPYHITNLGDDAELFKEPRLIERDGLLLIEYFLYHMPDTKMTMALDPISEDEAVIHGLGRFMGETIRALRDDRGEEVLYYGGYRLKRATE